MVSGLDVRDAVVRYGSTIAVDRVSLSVEPGEVVAVLGASGSGKSSLLRAIAGLEPLSGGSISWDGQDLAQVPVHRRGFAMMFQDGQLFPHLSVAGNVGYALPRLRQAQPSLDERARLRQAQPSLDEQARLRQAQPSLDERARLRQAQPSLDQRSLRSAERVTKGRDARVEELLELVGLSGYGPRPITELSGGQAQRVALARSLAAQPRLLLLDEPLSALDRGLRRRLVDVLDATLSATGVPALYVTHDQDEAFAIADKVALLDHGRLLQLADPATLWRHPASLEVAAFLGYSPFLDADAAAQLGWPGIGAGQVVAVGPAGLVPDPTGHEVPVQSGRARRGGTEFSVTLPNGGTGRVRTADIRAHRQPIATIRVRLNPDGCVVLPGPSRDPGPSRHPGLDPGSLASGADVGDPGSSPG